MDMHAAYREVGSYRAAAEICGTTPKTVKRSVEAAMKAGAGAVPGEVRHNYDGVADLVAETVARTKGRITAKRLLPVARAAGYTGSARNFRRLVAEAKVAWRQKNHRGRRPGIWAPGDTVVFDWGEIGPLFVFCAVVAWSRFRFVYFTDNLGAEATMEALAECFERIGGVPKNGTHRPHGMSEGRHGRRVGDPHSRVRALRHPLRVPSRLLRGCRPRVQGPGGEPGRLREVRPDDPRAAVGRRPGRSQCQGAGLVRPR